MMLRKLHHKCQQWLIPFLSSLLHLQHSTSSANKDNSSTALQILFWFIAINWLQAIGILIITVFSSLLMNFVVMEQREMFLVVQLIDRVLG